MPWMYANKGWNIRQRSEENDGVQTEKLKEMTGVLCDKKVPTSVKGKIHSTGVQSAVLCAMEVVPLSVKQERQFEVAEVKMCRWARGWTKRDRVRNERV